MKDLRETTPLSFPDAKRSSNIDKTAGSSRSNILSSSSFTHFFLRKSQVAKKRSVPVKTRQASPSCEDPSDTLTSKSSLISLELPRSGINLREWLESRGPDTSKIDKLVLFRTIVEMVDIAHAKGVALLELRPSSFVLLSTGYIQYAGPLMEFESVVDQKNRKKRRLDLDLINCSNNAELEKKWYSCPGELTTRDLLSFNIYCLGLLLFELLCHFESIEAHSATMIDLHHLILPPSFVSENPKEAGFCIWLLHPEPSSRPTTGEILQSEFIYRSDDTSHSNDAASCAENGENFNDSELDLLHHFLVSLKEHKQNTASKLSERIEFLEADIKEAERKHASRKFKDCDSKEELNSKNHPVTDNPSLKSGKILLRDKLCANIGQLEDAYFRMRSHVQDAEVPDAIDRSDKDILRLRLSSLSSPSAVKDNSVDRLETFFDGLCKFARYKKFEVCGTLRNDDILNSNSVICSLSFDREEEYIAVAGVSKKIKIFEMGSLLNEYVDVQYPVLEMSNESKISCVCWNNYIKNYLASTDYGGQVQMWDANTGQVIVQYKEHQKRAWSVDFSKLDPMKFASGSDDCSMKIWSINERSSTNTIQGPANVCCVQFSAFSSNLLAFGSADYKIYFYDIRHTRTPWCTLAGHGKAVSCVRFLDSETIISASTDNTLKLWDLKKTSLEGLSSKACSLTFTGHTNDKNFVGLAALDGYIACGSETNEVYAYYRSLPMPITSHKFGSVDPISGQETSDSNDHFVSSVCWRRKSEMLAAANSSGSIKILRLV